jgi:hypothetical protein
MFRRKKQTNAEPAAGSQGPSATFNLRPWEDVTLSAQKRYDSYKVVVEQKARDIVDAMSRPGITTEEQTAIRLNPESQFWYQELKQLRVETPERFCWRIDGGPLQELLGQNYLGAAQWQQGFGVDVGVVPPIPKSMTEELLESPCSLRPGELIKDTHILLLVPKTVNGMPYNALRLDALCADRKGSADQLIDEEYPYCKWTSALWAQTPQSESEWVLIPKVNPDPEKVPSEKHFSSKCISQQEQVRQDHYKDYREAKALEVMTAALLNDLVNGEPRMLDDCNLLRCLEPNAAGGRVCVGFFSDNGLAISVEYRGDGYEGIGLAIVRKL